jgi:hypothetical protein
MTGVKPQNLNFDLRETYQRMSELTKYLSCGHEIFSAFVKIGKSDQRIRDKESTDYSFEQRI